MANGLSHIITSSGGLNLTSSSVRKIALITGANRGIGLETARQLGRQQIVVLLGARDAEKGEIAATKLRGEGLEAHMLHLDVTIAESIRNAADRVTYEFGRLDILINNAAVLVEDQSKAVSEQAMSAWRITFDTNLFGVVATTQAFLPLLRKSDAGRIVNVSSVLGSNTLQSDPLSQFYDCKMPAYNVSKSSVNAYTVQLAYELRTTSIKVNAAHPGWVKTAMGGEAATMDVANGAKTIVALATLSSDGPHGAFMHLNKTLPW